MKLTFPHMGNIYVPMRAILTELNVDFVIPPPTSAKTLSLGVKYSPEGICIPFKITLGNFIEALDMGADAVLQAGGMGACRLGRYAMSQEQVLRQLGYKFEMIMLGVSENKLIGLGKMIKKVAGGAPWSKIISAINFGLFKQEILDQIEKKVQKMRPVEAERGSVEKLYRQAVKAVDEAGDKESVKRLRQDYLEKLDSLPKKPGAEPLIVGVMGEFYLVLDPFSSMDVEIELGKLGAEVRRHTFVSSWTEFRSFLNPFRKDPKEAIHRAAYPYLKRDVGGDGWESVGEKVLHSKDYDGIVHLLPFTCMPEIIAQNVMPSTKENIPVLSITCDEQMGKAGMLTRLEAFTDLLKRRRRDRRKIASAVGSISGH